MIDLALIALIVLYIGSIGCNIYAEKQYGKMSATLIDATKYLSNKTDSHNSNVVEFNEMKSTLNEVVNELGIQKEFNETLRRSRK